MGSTISSDTLRGVSNCFQKKKITLDFPVQREINLAYYTKYLVRIIEGKRIRAKSVVVLVFPQRIIWINAQCLLDIQEIVDKYVLNENDGIDLIYLHINRKGSSILLNGPGNVPLIRIENVVESDADTLFTHIQVASKMGFSKCNSCENLPSDFDTSLLNYAKGKIASRYVVMRCLAYKGSIEGQIISHLCHKIMDIYPQIEADDLSKEIIKLFLDPFLVIIISTLPLSSRICTNHINNFIPTLTVSELINILSFNNSRSENQTVKENKEFILTLYGWDRVTMKDMALNDVLVRNWLLEFRDIIIDTNWSSRGSYPHFNAVSGITPIDRVDILQDMFSGESLFLIRMYGKLFIKYGLHEKLFSAIQVLNNRQYFQVELHDGKVLQSLPLDSRREIALASMLDVVTAIAETAEITDFINILMGINALDSKAVSYILSPKTSDFNILSTLKICSILIYKNDELRTNDCKRNYPDIVKIIVNALVKLQLDFKSISDLHLDVVKIAMSMEWFVSVKGLKGHIEVMTDGANHQLLLQLRDTKFLETLGRRLHSSLNTLMADQTAVTDSYSEKVETSVKFEETVFFGYLLWGVKINTQLTDNHLIKVLFRNVDKSLVRRSVFAPNARFRIDFVRWLVEFLRLESFIIEKFSADGFIFTCKEHYHLSVLNAFQLKRTKMKPQDFIDILFAGLKIGCHDDLSDCMQEIDKFVFLENKRMTIFMCIISEVLTNRTLESFTNTPGGSPVVTFSDFITCAEAGIQSLKILSDPGISAATRLNFENVFPNYIRSNPPASWLPFFKSSATLALFIRYADREDISKAYEAFLNCNGTAKTKSETVQSLINQVRVEFYSQPFINVSALAASEEEGLVDRVIEGLLNESKQGNLPEVVLLAKELCSRWMAKTRDTIKIAMAVRNSQLITYFVMAKWIYSPTCKAFLAQVETGEGKSLIIAMIAIYVVRVLKKRVHIMVNNAGLLNRDFATYKEYYENCDVSVTKHSLGDAKVVYCLRVDLEDFYRNKIISRQLPFSDTCLIVDEVDSLIVDEKSHSSRVKDDEEFSKLIPEYFDNLSNTSFSASNQTIWNECKTAQRTANAKREGFAEPNGYCQVDDTYYLNDERGRILKNYYALWLEYIRYKNSPNRTYKPKYKSNFFVESLLHMMSQYQSIVGLSGSLGSPKEQEFLARTYGTLSMYVPPFLNTCRDVCQETPVLIEDTVFVYPSNTLQINAVWSMAQRLSRSVPVLIICGGPITANMIYQYLPLPVGEGKQLLLEFDPVTRANMKWDSIVENVTKPRDMGGYRITVTDYWGGRGMDYRITDSDVDDAGGFAVIITTIPDSVREWIQWVGRTARSGNKGQYAVLLSKEDKLFEGVENSILTSEAKVENQSVAYKANLIQKLLAIGDAKIADKLESIRQATEKGQRLNALCDDFYQKYSRENVPWPSSQEDRDLRDFLASGDHSVTGVQSMRKKLKL